MESKVIGIPCRSIFHAPKSSQMQYTAKIKKSNNLNNQIKNPLELRLAKDPNPAAEKNVDTSRLRTGKPNPCNHHIYHFHVLESPHLDF